MYQLRYICMQVGKMAATKLLVLSFHLNVFKETVVTDQLFCSILLCWSPVHCKMFVWWSSICRFRLHDTCPICFCNCLYVWRYVASIISPTGDLAYDLYDVSVFLSLWHAWSRINPFVQLVPFVQVVISPEMRMSHRMVMTSWTQCKTLLLKCPTWSALGTTSIASELTWQRFAAKFENSSHNLNSCILFPPSNFTHYRNRFNMPGDRDGYYYR